MQEEEAKHEEKGDPNSEGPQSDWTLFPGDTGRESSLSLWQIPLDPASGELVKGDIRQGTKRVLENLKGVLESQHLGMDDVVKVTIFLKDMGNFSQVNEVYGTYFPSSPPARSTVEVARLPRDAGIEIEAIALTHGGEK